MNPNTISSKHMKVPLLNTPSAINFWAPDFLISQAGSGKAATDNVADCVWYFYCKILIYPRNYFQLILEWLQFVITVSTVESGNSPLNLEWNISLQCVKTAFACCCICKEHLGGVAKFLTVLILNTTPSDILNSNYTQACVKAIKS